MLDIQTWLRNKKNLTILICALASVYLGFGVLLPLHENIPYYQRKIETLEQDLDRLKTLALHVDYYENRKDSTKMLLTRHLAEIEQVRNPSILQNSLSKLQRQHQLDLMFQKIHTPENHPDYSKIVLNQSLSGLYPNLSGYLGSIAEQSPYILISVCELINDSPLQPNPVVVMNLELVFYLPNLQ